MSGARLTVVWWRDIPAQVTAKRGRERAAAPLPERFQEAIDRAAMRAGLAGTDEYLSEWRREARDCGGDLQAEAEAAAARLDAEFSDQRLQALVSNRGVAPEQ